MSEGKTFAFSTKSKAWTTRYSFTPSQYAHIDDEFLSCDTFRGLNNTIWEHERGADYNSFYGTTYSTYVAVSSNQDPSKEKVFKAVSLETNEGNWSSVLITNDDAENDIYFKIQQSFIPSFISKEGNKYSHVPPSERNSTRNLNFLGLVAANEIKSSSVFVNIQGWQAGLDTAITNFFSEYKTNPDATATYPLGVAPYTTPSQVTNLNQKGRFAYLRILPTVNELRTIYMLDEPSGDSGFQGSLALAAYTNAVSLKRIPVFIESSPAANVYFDIKMIVDFLLNANNITYEEFAEQTISESLPFQVHVLEQTEAIGLAFDDDNDSYSPLSRNIPLYSILEPSIDGDSIRGKYMNIALFLDNPSLPMELYAINTEYIDSKLDSSFDQNS